jgi:hypothetical protein
MHDNYKQAILEQLDSLLAEDLRDSANYSVMMMVRDQLIAKGVPSATAEYVATHAQIQIHPDIWLDTAFIQTVVDKYTSIVVKILNHADKVLMHSEHVFHLIEDMNLLLVP